jgi:hypothetical protein
MEKKKEIHGWEPTLKNSGNRHSRRNKWLLLAVSSSPPYLKRSVWGHGGG